MPTIITKTIGKDGWQDYSTFGAAEAAVPTIAGGSDLVSLDVAVVFEAYSAEYDELVNINGSLTTDATRNVTYTAAENSKHGGVPGAGVVIKKETSASFAVAIEDDYTKIQDIEVKRFGTSDGRACVFVTGDPPVVTLENVIINNDGDDGVRGHGIVFNGQSASYNGTIYVNNCLFVNNTKYAVQYNLFTVSGGPNVYADNNTALDCERFIGVDNNLVNQLGTISLNNNIVGRINGAHPGTLYATQTTDPLAPRPVGTGNIGFLSDRFDSSAIVGSQAWTFTSATGAASTGSQLIYDPITYKLVNVSGNDAIGVGTASEAPTTTDIAGNDRLRGASDEYVDPGAFTSDKVTYTKSIGSGKDYTTFTAAEADLGVIPYSVDLAERNLEIVFEAYAGTYTEPDIFVGPMGSGLGPGNSVTFTAAAGNGHQGNKESGVIADTAMLLRSLMNFMTFDNLVITRIAASNSGSGYANPITVKNCLVKNNVAFRSSQGPAHLVENTVFSSGEGNNDNIGINADTNTTKVNVVNCTFYGGESRNIAYTGSTGDAVIGITNCLFADGGAHLADFTGGLPLAISGSNNCAAAVGSGDLPSSIKTDGVSWTFTSATDAASTGSQVIYEPTTYKMLNVTGNDAVGVGVGSATVVPTTDILGNPRIRGGRDEYADPGAFTTDKITATKTIDLNGTGDYTTFKTAEAAVVSVAKALLGGNRTNLPQRNGEIVYEAVKGTYEFNSWWDINDNFAVQKGPENRVIYRPKAGSEHGGIPLEGVVLGWTANGSLHNYEPFTQIEGLNLSAYPGGQHLRGRVGGEYWKDNIMIATPEDRTVWSSEGIGVSEGQYRKDTSASPRVMENNLVIGRLGLGSNVTCPPNNILANNTFKFGLEHGNINKHLNVSAYNNLSLNSDKVYGAYYGIIHYEGSGNVGSSALAYPWPSNAAGFKGDIVPVDDESDIPVSGDYILYQPEIYKLIDSPRNAAINEGVGTSAGTFIPSTDIQGVIRGSTSSNPGAFQLLFVVPVFQNVSLNTGDSPETIRDFFHNPFAPGPSPAVAHVTLPDDTIPVFIVLGDSTAMGTPGSDDSLFVPETYQPYIDAQGDDWPQTAFDGSDIGYFWNKWMSTSDGGVTFDKPIQSLIDWSTSGDAFHPLHPRLGGDSFGSFTYAPSGDGSVGVAEDIVANGKGKPGNISPIWDLFRSLKGLFKKANGEIIPPHIIIMGYASQRLGTPGLGPYTYPPDLIGTWDYHADATDGGLVNQGATFKALKQVHIKPAVDHIVNTMGKNPVLAGEIFMIGGSEAQIGRFPDIENVLSATQTYLTHMDAVSYIINNDVQFPSVMYEPWIGGLEEYDKDRLIILQKAIKGLFDDGLRSKVFLNDLTRAGTDDVHFMPLAYKLYGERFASAYLNMCRTRSRRIVAPTMGNIRYDS